MAAVTPGIVRTSHSVLDLIGHTPLVRLSSFERGLGNVELWAKAEWRNPGGSVKDRPAARMILDGERSGALTRDKIILACTVCEERNYHTTKNKRLHPDRVEFKKYCRWCRKHTKHKETR